MDYKEKLTNPQAEGFNIPFSETGRGTQKTGKRKSRKNMKAQKNTLNKYT